MLPARLPNLLINGSSGIAVGMATNIPPHNLLELNNIIIKLINNPSITLAKLFKDFKGPDFPTGGEIIKSKKEKNLLYKDGRGSFFNLKLVRGVREGDAILYKKLKRLQIKELHINQEQLKKLMYKDYESYIKKISYLDAKGKYKNDY